MKRILLILAAAAVWFGPSIATAGLSLPQIFGDHMVLQRDATVPVFGTADAGAEVRVSIAGQTKTATAGDDGRFRVDLEPMEATFDAQTLEVASGEATKSYSDVLIGEVWVCSGQSNMEWPVASSVEAELEMLTANRPNIRLIEIESVTSDVPLDDVPGEWKVCTPETVRDFSAVGYYFGRTLQDVLDVPIGLIDSTWGGTRAEAWTPPEALAAQQDLQVLTDAWAEKAKRYDPEAAKIAHEKATEAWKAKWATFRKQQQSGTLPPGSQGPRRPSLQGDPNVDRHNPSRLWNAMVNGMVPYAIRGAIWYQGESNSSRAKQYKSIMPTMIHGWREAWGQGDFPFYQVQLANFKEKKDEPSGSDWAELREAQDYTTEVLPNVGKVVITDIGAAKDIHPKDKQNVAKRLARLALVDVYGYSLTREGPQYDGVDFTDGKAIVTFKGLGEGAYKGLETYYRQPLRGFTIAGEDQTFYNANAKIKGDKVIVSHPEVKQPTAVRYNWADNPSGTLQNRAGLPAEPFRTDEYPGWTDNNVNP